jgi:hypothetical protein
MLLIACACWIFGWLWSIWRGFGVGIICGLLNFFFPPLSQLIFSLYEKRLRAPTLLMVFGMILSIYSAWHGIHEFLNRHQLPSGGVMVHWAPASDELTIASHRQYIPYKNT